MVVESRQEDGNGILISKTIYFVDTHGNILSTTQWKQNEVGQWVAMLPSTNTYDELGRLTDTWTESGAAHCAAASTTRTHYD